MNIKEYFEFSKKELNGLIILCLLLILIAAAPQIYSWFKPEELYDYTEFEKEVNEFLASADSDTYSVPKSYAYTTSKSAIKPQYFEFNPNNLPEYLWKKLGLSERQVKVIKNFEAKGGKFYRKEDLKKIYSITDDDYQRLEPYINIPTQYNNSKYTFNSYNRRAVNNRTLKIIDLNKADSLELESLKGIGPTFARRIIKFRSRLGGFWRKEQLLEVYGMDTAKYELLQSHLVVHPEDVVKLNINQASFKDLRRFPYLSYKQINALLQYRNQHGNYSSSSDLKKVLILTEAVVSQLEPYLAF